MLFDQLVFMATLLTLTRVDLKCASATNVIVSSPYTISQTVAQIQVENKIRITLLENVRIVIMNHIKRKPLVYLYPLIVVESIDSFILECK